MTTVKDVAKYAGVSIATVSRVIRNEATVSPQTKEAVLHAIAVLNYTPNALARQMRQQSTKMVIVVVPDIGNTFFHDIIRGIELASAPYGYQILIADMNNHSDIEAFYLDALAQKQVDGVISLSANVGKALISKIANKYPVVVACQYLENSDIPNVTIDNIAAAKDMVTYLIGLGHTNIAHLTSDPSNLLYRDRFNGYISALAQHNLPIDLELVRYSPSTIQDGKEQMNALLNLGKPISAVFTAGDALAIGAMIALREAGIQVPTQISVAGFDDIEFSSIFSPALTTVRQPKAQLGETAFLKLLKLMHGEQLEHRQVLLDYDLVYRESCAPPPKHLYGT